MNPKKLAKWIASAILICSVMWGAVVATKSVLASVTGKQGRINQEKKGLVHEIEAHGY